MTIRQGPIHRGRPEILVNGTPFGMRNVEVHLGPGGLPIYWLRTWHRGPALSRGLDHATRVELRHWRDHGPPLAVRWLLDQDAPSGAQTTNGIATDAADAGWATITAHHGHTQHTPRPRPQHLAAPGIGLLLIVEHADYWPLPDLAALLSNRLLRHPHRPSRILLTSHPSEDTLGAPAGCSTRTSRCGNGTGQ